MGHPNHPHIPQCPCGSTLHRFDADAGIFYCGRCERILHRMPHYGPQAGVGMGAERHRYYRYRADDGEEQVTHRSLGEAPETFCQPYRRAWAHGSLARLVERLWPLGNLCPLLWRWRTFRLVGPIPSVAWLYRAEDGQEHVLYKPEGVSPRESLVVPVMEYRAPVLAWGVMPSLEGPTYSQKRYRLVRRV